MTNATVQVKRVTIFRPNRTPVQVQRVPFKSPGGTTIPARKSMPPRPVIPSLNTWRHDPRLGHTCTSAEAQLVIRDHLNRLYHPVTGQCKTYDKLNLWHPKLCITSMYNELGRLVSGVEDRMTSGTDTIFLSTRIKYQQEGRQNMPIQSMITGH